VLTTAFVKDARSLFTRREAAVTEAIRSPAHLILVLAERLERAVAVPRRLALNRAIGANVARIS